MKKIDLEQYKVKPNQAIQLKDLPTNIKSDEEKQQEIQDQINQNSEKLKKLQQRLLAEEKRGLIFVLQAMDAAGKDEAERYLFSRLSSQALHTTSFDKPSEEDLRHDYLWRLHDAMPERGMIGVFNRSHYENLVAARVYNSIEDEPLPDHIKNDSNIWEKRFKHVNNFEDYLADNGFYMIKIYLHVSKDIQKERLIERIEDSERNWEFSFSDLTDREHWEELWLPLRTHLKIHPPKLHLGILFPQIMENMAV